MGKLEIFRAYIPICVSYFSIYNACYRGLCLKICKENYECGKWSPVVNEYLKIICRYLESFITILSTSFQKCNLNILRCLCWPDLSLINSYSGQLLFLWPSFEYTTFRISCSFSTPFLCCCCCCLVTELCPAFAMPWSIAHQAPLSMGLPRQEYWSELPFPPAGDFPTQGSNACLLCWQVDTLSLSYLGGPTPLLCKI